MNSQAHYRLNESAKCNVCDTQKNLIVNCAGFSNQKVNRHYTRHDYYLIYAIDGELKITIGTQKFLLSAGQFIIIPPETKLFYKTPKNMTISYFWIHFTGKCAKEILCDYKLSENTVYTVGVQNRIMDLFQKIFNELLLKDSFFDDTTSLSLNEIFIYLSRCISRNSILPKLAKSIVYIHENYPDEIDIEYLAQKENMCPSLYRAKFKSVTGFSPKEYIINLRIEYAMRLLSESNMKIKEIACNVGYKDMYYFSRIFKNKTGISPKVYRDNNKKSML